MKKYYFNYILAAAETAINGVYQEFTVDGFYGMFNNQSVYFNDLQTDYVKAGAQTNSAHIRELSNFAIQPTNLFVSYAWEEHYTAINRANVVIDKVTDASFLDEQSKQNYINEARFLRGFTYFNLVRYFGGVPIVLHDGDGEGASAILSKVYLTWAQTLTEEGKANQAQFYQKAIQYADKVINSKKYHLLDKFIDIWSVDKKHGPEHIFTIEHDRTINGNVSGHCTFATNWDNAEPVLLATSDKYYEQTDPRDQRRDGSWAKKLYNPNTGEDFVFTIPRFRKYIDSLNYANTASPGNSAGQSINTAIIRYAEILLIKAEAENELNGPTAAAYDAINQVRRRAYWSPYDNVQNTPSDGSALELSGLSQAEFRERLREERRLEFVLEGQRWFDLIRWHILVKYVKANTPSDAETLGTKTTKIQNVSKKNYLLPLPLEQLILNPSLEQNWGYSGETGDGPYGPEYE